MKGEDQVHGSTVLVTGASGLFGRPLVRRLVELDNEVVAVARFSDPEIRRELERDGATCVAWDLGDHDLGALPARVEHVFHAGAFLPVRAGDAAHRAQVDQRTVFDANVQAAGRLLWRYREARSFFYCSSGRAYADAGHDFLREDMPLGVGSAMADYALSKLACEQLLQFLGVELGTPVVIARVFSLYGPLGGYLTRVVERILRGGEVALHPDRPVHSTVMYEDDYVDKAIALASHAASPPLVVNFAGSEDTVVEDYCRLAGQLAGRPVRFVDDATAPSPRRADVTLMESLVGPCKVPVKQGIRAVLEVLENPGRAR